MAELMLNPLNHPVLLFVISMPALWFGARVGAIFHNRIGKLDANMLEDFKIVQLYRIGKLDANMLEDFKLILGATLTLLGLIIGFTFSMAVSRYDQRKNLEEQEANAIGTEYVRADLLPASDAARLQTLLKSYLEQRILYYATSDVQLLERINIRTAQLQTELWSSV